MSRGLIDKEGVDVLIVTIIPELEFESVSGAFRRHFGERSNFRHSELDPDAHRFEFSVASGDVYSAMVVANYRQGNVYSSALTSGYLQRFFPGFAILFGIGGNVFPDVLSKGDVVIGEQVYYEEVSRISEGEKFISTNHPIPHPSEGTSQKFRKFLRKNKIDLEPKNQNAIRAKIKNGDRRPKIEVGAIFCSNAVIDCSLKRGKIQGLGRNYKVVEMEAAGFLLSLENYSVSPKMVLPNLIIRGISDDCAQKNASEASDGVDWRQYAAENAAEVLVAFIDQLNESYFEPS